MLTKQEFEIWIEALESGEYKQGLCYLNSDDKFCCLGVLADTMGVKWEEYESARRDFRSESEKIYEILCFEKKDETHVCSVPQSWIDLDLQSELMELNDEEYFNFNEIAEHLRENKENFF